MWIRDISCRSASGPQAINSQPFGHSTRSGIGCCQGATFRRRCGGSRFQKQVARRDRWVFRRSLTASPRKSPGASFTPGQQCRRCQMSRAGELLERKQGLLDRMQKEPGAIKRTEIEQALKAINEALNRLESEQLDAPVPHH